MNINKNNIDEIKDLAVLKNLTQLFAADNKLSDTQVKVQIFLKTTDETSNWFKALQSSFHSIKWLENCVRAVQSVKQACHITATVHGTFY